MKLKSTLLLGISLALPASAASYLTSGHIDAPAFGYVSNADFAADNTLTQGFEPHMHNHGDPDGAVIDGFTVAMESEYEPGEVTLVVPESSTTTLNSLSYYWLPQDETDAANNGTPYAGIGIEELSAADWTSGTVTISLVGFTGPGDIVLWQDGFPNPDIFFDSPGDSRSFAAGSHTHFNWGFTAPGDYELEFAISGTHVDDGFQTASGNYTFNVVPEPSSTAVLGLFGVLGVLRRRR